MMEIRRVWTISVYNSTYLVIIPELYDFPPKYVEVPVT